MRRTTQTTISGYLAKPVIGAVVAAVPVNKYVAMAESARTRRRR
jgi:hypothetical protein